MRISLDIGFIVLKLTNNTLCDSIIDCAQNFIQNNPFDQIVLFNSFCDKTDTGNVPILHLNHAKFFYGKLFVFDLISVLLSQNFTNISKRYLYVTDIPWLDYPSTPHGEWSQLYMQPNVDIVVSNDKLFDIYKLAWKQPIGICEDLNYEKIQHII